MKDSHVVLMRHRLLALDRRYLFALPNITVGRVTREIVSELQQIAGEYDELLKGELTLPARLSEATVRTKIGDALGSAAWACEALHEPEQARVHFVAAAIAYTRAGASGRPGDADGAASAEFLPRGRFAVGGPAGAPRREVSAWARAQFPPILLSQLKDRTATR